MNWIFRASLPVSAFPVSPSGNNTTGFVDLNVFAAYRIGTPDVSFGIWSQLTASTGEDAPSGEKWSAALPNVLFDASPQELQ